MVRRIPTVADILSHRAGLPEHPYRFEQYLNWTAITCVARGTAQGYHALTYGGLTGELIARVDLKKRTVRQFTQDEIEFYIGLPANQEHRVSPLEFTDLQGIVNRSMLDVDYCGSKKNGTLRISTLVKELDTFFHDHYHHFFKICFIVLGFYNKTFDE